MMSDDTADDRHSDQPDFDPPQIDQPPAVQRQAMLSTPNRVQSSTSETELPSDENELSLIIYLAGLSTRMTVLFGLYVLSIGPMYWQWQSGKFGNGSPIIAAFYEPLFRLANIDDPLHIGEFIGEWLNYYIGLWVQ